MGSNLMGALGTFETTTSEFVGDGGDPFFRDNSPLSSHTGFETGWTFVSSSYSGIEALGLTSIGRTTDNPRSGSRALRIEFATDDNTVNLYLAGGRQCGSMSEYPVSFRANEGDLVTFAIWYEVNWTTSGPTWGIALDFVDEDAGGVPIDSVFDAGSTSDVGTFAQLEASGVAPADTYWVRCRLQISGAGVFDFDDGTLAVA